MKGIALSCLLMFVVVCDAFAQFSYRVKKGNNEYYIIPPQIRLRFNNQNELAKKFNHYYIEISLLNGDYTHDVERLESSLFGNRRKSRLPSKSVNGCACTFYKGQFFSWYFPLLNGSELSIEFYFQKLHHGSAQMNYNAMMTELIQSLANLEGTANCNCAPKLKLAVGFSQQLLRRLKDKIPMPAGIRQPGLCLTNVQDQSNFMLLDEDIALKIDNIDKTVTGSKFEYDWQGSKIMRFRRDDKGSIQQNGFALFNNGLPNNNYAPALYKLSSFADIQSSEALKGKYYIALYHPPLKRNNDHGTDGNLGMYGPADDKDRAVGNPFILHLNSQELHQLNFGTAFGSADSYTKSFFSPRGSIAPLITIMINGQEKFTDFDLHPADIGYIPRKFKLYRKCGDRYRRVKGAIEKIFLQPNDHIKYTL